MARFLPPQPSLDHLKNEAKAIHKAHQRKDAAACAVLRRVHRFRSASDDEILAADVPLAEAQFALAMEYGFAGWAELRQGVLGLQPVAHYHPNATGDAMLLPSPAAGIKDFNRFAAAFSMALSYVGAAADDVTVAGDSGLAFILQADSLHHPWNRDRKELDIGWWPLDSWGAMLRLDFLGRAHGIPMRLLPSVAEEYGTDSAAHYQKHHQLEILRSLHAGRPVVTVQPGTEGICFVCGYDGGDPPLLGQLSCEATVNVHRMEKLPWEIVILDEPTSPMDRKQVDREALDFAVRMGRDAIDLHHLPGKSAGRRSWELWVEQIEDPQLCGPGFYHANVVGHLHQNRSAAARYLRAMGERHAKPVERALLSAAGEYDKVLAVLGQTGPAMQALNTAEGRGQMVELVRQMMMLEGVAQEHMAAALEWMR